MKDLGNASLRYARSGNPRDMYEIAVWKDSVVKSGKDMFAINTSRGGVIPESIDAIVPR